MSLDGVDGRDDFSVSDTGEYHWVAEKHLVFQKKHNWSWKSAGMLGVKTNNKVAHGLERDICGVYFNLSKCFVSIKDSRRWSLEVETLAELKTDLLTLVQAAKLWVKLVFVSGHYKGQAGRCHIKPIADRQHFRRADHRLSLPLTDGSHPETWKVDHDEEGLPRVGWTVFLRRDTPAGHEVYYCSMVVDQRRADPMEAAANTGCHGG